MAVSPDAGLVVRWPASRPVRAWWMEKSEEDQKEEIARQRRLIERAFARAKAYHLARQAGAGVAVDIRWEAMRRSLPLEGRRPERPVFVLAGELEQIRDVVAFGVRHGLRIVIVGGRDADLCASLLSEHGVGVIVTGVLSLPKRADSPVDESFGLPARLEKAGVRWCLASGQGPWNERNLPHVAAMAVRHGLAREAAIRAITLSAAQMLGVGNRLGSLEPGKLATLIVTDGDPLEITTNVGMAFIDGRRIDLADKQSRLHEKYREKYRQLGLIR
jgi:imidazolonepropionase-like amidohydrolase